MKITVKFFARYRDLAGVSEIEVEVNGFTVDDVLMDLKKRFHRIPWDEALISVNHKYADKKMTLKDGDILSVFPQVSGG